MNRKSLGVEEGLYQYLLSISLKEPEILKKLREETAKQPLPLMQISPEVGQFIALLVTIIGAKKTLEIGVFTGYSSLIVALALPPEGQITALDISYEFTETARRYWKEAQVEQKIDLRIAPALETLDQLIVEESGLYDFIFIDADKSNYYRYYEKCLTLLRTGGLMAIDNVLWNGQVIDQKVQDTRTTAIRLFNQKLHQDPRIGLSVLPIGDGLTLACKL